ncbi:MAG TPA: hypothetical protein VEB86_08115, partial [Chryseosolibacter sp.]|nr:hypothetical protein [Chryseosolibacter sp.]
MKKINFFDHVLPHIVAVAVFLLVTFIFFKPVFFENKVLSQPDIQQFQGTSKTIVDYREETGEEALWAESIFSGMPAYLVSVSWGNTPISYLKNILSLWLPHAVNNIFLSFICFYILLLSFGVRPYLAIGGSLAFGLSSYMIIGVLAGHNARVGAIAFMPLVLAGIHLAFTRSRILGFAVTTAGLALHFRDNHLQMTYYLLLIVVAYGIVQLVSAIKTGTLPRFFKSTAVVTLAALLAMGTFFGPFWAITEYTAYSIRGKSELSSGTDSRSSGETSGLSKTYAFDYSNGILEPMTLLIPNFYGGSTTSSVLENRQGETFKELQRLANSGDQQTLN